MALALAATGCEDDITGPDAADRHRVTLGTVPIQSDPADLPALPGTPDPQMRLVLDQIAAANVRPLHTLAPFQARNEPPFRNALVAAIAAQGRPASAALQPVARIEHRKIGGVTANNGDSVLVRVYTPSGTGPFPVAAYYHGGGRVITDLDDYDASPRALANAAGAVIVSVAYRQAPTNKFATAHEDAFTAYQWVLANAATIGGDPARVAVVGESAGGNMAAAICLNARDEGVPLPVHQVLVYPMAGHDTNTESYLEMREAVPLNKPAMEWFLEQCLNTPAEGQAPAISLNTGELSGLPSTTIINAELDPLRTEGETHEFVGMTPVLAKAREAQQMAASALRPAFGDVAAGGSTDPLQTR